MIYVEGTVFGGKDIRIYVHRRFRKEVEHLVGKRVRILIIGEVEK